MLEIYKNLNYALQKLTKKVLDTKNDIKNKTVELKKHLIFIIFPLLYIILFYKHYLYLLSKFSLTKGIVNFLETFEFIKINSIHINIFFVLLHIIILTIFLISLIRIILLNSKIKKLQSNINLLKRRIKELLSSDFCFCNCSHNCNCQDEYIKYMESEGIDLIF